MKSGRLPLCLLIFLALFSCKALPPSDPGGDEPPAYSDEGLYGEDFGGEDYGGYDYEGWDVEEDPSLALPPGLPDDAWPGDLIEPSLENGEAVLPDSPPEAAAPVLAEPLPEPVPPDLAEPPEPPGEPSPEEPSLEPPGELAGEPAPEEPSAPEEAATAEEEAPPPEAPPPPPPRIVRPSEPLPPPPPAREPLPMPPAPVPDLPARVPPTLAPEASPDVSSRTVRALTGQIVEVPFRGTGWVYLGEASSKRGVDYSSRRLDGEGQTFVFRAVEAGVYELKFYRQDFIRDYIINDMVTVIVEEPPQALSRSGSAAERVVAEPRWPTVAGRSAPGTGDATSEAGEARPATGNAGPAARDATLGTRDAGPAARDAGPTARDVAPTARDAGPAARDATLGTRDAGPAARDVAPTARDAAPATRDAAPGTGNAVLAPQAGPAVPGAAGIAGAVVPGTAVPGGASATADGATDGGAALGDAESAAAVLPRDTAAEEYLRKAREEYRGERYPQATAILDQFMERFPLGSDEAYWIYAQICEKQGPSRNIRLALDYYRRLVAEYPQSGRYNDARRRIAYLERYYINIQ